jgi:RHS repeat-associated protein
MARHHRMGDVAVGTGTTDSADYMLALANYGSVPARGDANRDGDVNVNDVLAIIGDINAGPALGKLSITDNQIGWDGYVFNAEADPDGMYTVRHRHYKPTLGRWIERDPLTFDEAMNLFQFAKSNSVIYLDDTGAQTTQPAPTPNYQDPKRWNTSPCKRDRRREGRQYIPENDACVAVCDALARDNAKELEDSNKESEGRPRKIGGHTYGISYCDKKDKDGNPIRGTCCVCRKNYQPTGASPEAVELSFLCTLTHEETHNMQSCTGDSNCREAEAYEEERKCLEASKASCRDSGRFPKVADQSRCERHVSERIKNVEKQRDKFKALCSCKD